MNITRPVWNCYALTKYIPDAVIRDFQESFQRRDIILNCTEGSYHQVEIRTLYGRDQKSGELILYQNAESEDVFKGGFLSLVNEEELESQLGLEFQRWITENNDTIIEKVDFTNKVQLAIADRLLSKDWNGVKLVYTPQTKKHSLRRLELEISGADIRVLSEGDAEQVMSSKIMPYLHAKTGIRCAKLPIAELKIYDRILITRSWFRVLDNSKNNLAHDVLEVVLNSYNSV